MRVAPKRLPGEVPWSPNWIYDCTRGHYIQADEPVAQCPAFLRGEKCDGDLVQVGPKGGRIRTGAVS